MNRAIISISSVSILASVWLFLPFLNHSFGTSENITVEVIANPFIENERLVYQWSGNVVNSCPVELRRFFVDSDDVVTNLTSKHFGALPENLLGQTSYEISVDVPLRIASGRAIYQVIEVPSCSWLQKLFPIAIEYPPVEFFVSRND